MSDGQTIIAQYYTDKPVKPRRSISELQKLKNSYKSLLESKNKYIHKNGKEIDKIRYRNLASEYIELNMEKK